MARETIHYTTAPTNLGRMLLARSEYGICALFINNHEHLLLGELESNFPAASLIRDDKNLSPMALQIALHINQPGQAPALLLDLRGTDFQKRVWASLQQIPAGQTLSYTELAQRMGMTRGARAVASACAANRLAVIIPCHRVIGNKGALSGYRWGIERKQQLLALETA